MGNGREKMAGYIVELYKNIISDGKVEQSIEDPNLKNKIYITFGEYDKMTVSRTNAFSRMRDVSKMSKEWIGDRQKILLYDLTKDNELEYMETTDGCGFYIYEGLKRVLCDKLFLGITILQFKECQAECDCRIVDRLNICRKRILDIVKENSKNEIAIDCSVLGLLGSYGVAVLWGCDQFTEILRMINIIKGSDIFENEDTAEPAYKFISVFTIFVKNKDACSPVRIEKIEGMAMLQMTLQTNIHSGLLKELKDSLSGIESFHSVGEYDLIVITSARDLYDCFNDHHIFDPSSSFYEKYVLQTSVKLCETISENDVETIKEVVMSKEEVGEKSASETNTFSCVQIQNAYKMTRSLFFEVFPKTAGMVDSLDLLYGDYNSKIAVVSNKMWAKDYGQQFLAILNVVNNNLSAVVEEKVKVSTPELLADVQDILNCFEYQTIHIAESNNFLLDTPKCHLRYTGQNNLTLYAYFGILKDILELVYLIQAESKQSKIIPLISVDTVPIISSILYMDYDNPFEDRIIQFNFPMMAMFALPANVPYLYHEVFHYVAPKDRVIRNWTKGVILAIQAIKNIINEIMVSMTEEKDYDSARNIVDGIFTPYVYKSVINQYFDPVIQKVSKQNSTYTKNEINEEGCVWNKYEKKLFYNLICFISEADRTLLEDNLVYKVFQDLYLSETEIKKCFETMLDAEYLDETEKDCIQEMFDYFMDAVNALFINVSSESKLNAFNEMMKITGLSAEELINLEELVQLSSTLSEVVCDLPMVELAQMDAIAYLISYVKIQKDLLKKPNNEPQIQNFVRIGVVLDSFFQLETSAASCKRKLDALKSGFICSYVGLYFSEKKAFEHSNLKAYVDEIKVEAEAWFSEIKNWYCQYLKKYRIFGSLIKILMKQASIKERINNEETSFVDRFKNLKCAPYNYAVRTYGSGIIEAVINRENSSLEEKKEHIVQCRNTFQEEVFGMNIEIIQTYQKQRGFEELGEICNRKFKGDEIYKYEMDDKIFESNLLKTGFDEEKSKKEILFQYEYMVTDIVGLCDKIKQISDHFEKLNKKYFGSKNMPLWYRGHQNYEYKLLPTAMRNYAQHAQENNSLRDFQRGAYEEFRFRIDNASEKIEKSGYTECDYLALMQHYGAPTIYMDWTENAISALYFALEAFIDPKKKDFQNDKDAVLYILHPQLYNRARNEIMNQVKIDSGRILDQMMKESILSNTYNLPNLSVNYNKEKFGMFLLGDVNDNNIIVKPRDTEIQRLSMADGEKENLLYLPLAIYASRANERVKAQSGMFMAFNIFTMPSRKKYFDYMALEKVQEFYLKNITGAFPFMYTIRVDGSVKKEIADWLKAMGLTKDMIYPELSNIVERI